MSKTEHRYKNAVVRNKTYLNRENHYVFPLREIFGLTWKKLRFEKYAARGDRTAFFQKFEDDKTISAFSINRVISI